MKLFIRNMTTEDCSLSVKAELNKLEIKYNLVELGQVGLSVKLADKQREQLAANLLNAGFELLGDNKPLIIKNVKQTIYDTVHYQDNLSEVDLSDYLAWRTGYSYPFLSHIFAEETGGTIEHFFMYCKMVFAKEMLKDCSLSLSEIAEKLHYSSISHLSAQFKKSYGQTPSGFRKANSKCFEFYQV